MLDRCFELRERGATLGGEIRGGLTTFMVMAYSITNGIGAGFLAYCFIKLVRGKGRQVHLMMYLAAAAFVVYFALPLLQRLLSLR